MKVFHTERFSDGWSQFLGILLPDSLTDEKKQKSFMALIKTLSFLFTTIKIFSQLQVVRGTL